MKQATARLLGAPSLVLMFGFGLLAACGTEIGNGKQPPTLPGATTHTDSKSTNTATGQSETDSNNTPTTPESATTSGANPLEYLLIACGSPIPDMTVSTFKDQIGLGTLTVTLPLPDSWNLVMTTPAANITVQKNATTAQPNGIKSDATLGTQSCSSLTSVLNGDLTEKSILYSDNFKTTWSIDGNSHVTEIKVEDAAGVLVRDWLLQ